MLTRTTLLAIRMLLRVANEPGGRPISPRRIAGEQGESATYLAKVARLLVTAGILRSHRGVSGGLTLAREPRLISLRQVVEACQGPVVPTVCAEVPLPGDVCAFHRMGTELHEAITGILSRWTLGDLDEVRSPGPGSPLRHLCLLGPERAGRDAPARSAVRDGKVPGRAGTRP